MNTPCVLAIDPGTTHSGWCTWDGTRVLDSDNTANEELAAILRGGEIGYDLLAVEMIQNMGRPAGKTLFETAVWIGRFIEAAGFGSTAPHRLIYRTNVKLHLCGTSRAKDPHIRQRLIDLYGPVGSKKCPGPLYGVRSHVWSALAIAVTASETQAEAA
jgi:hypothetical protein